MKILVSVYIVVAFCVAASLQYTPHTRCETGPLPKALRVQGCSSSPCKIYRGTGILAEMDFVANADTNVLMPSAILVIPGHTIRYKYSDACKGSLKKGKCPLKKGDEVTYSFHSLITSSSPSLPFNMEFKILDKNNNVQMCFKMDGILINKEHPDSLVFSSIEEKNVINIQIP